MLTAQKVAGKTFQEKSAPTNLFLKHSYCTLLVGRALLVGLLKKQQKSQPSQRQQMTPAVPLLPTLIARKPVSLPAGPRNHDHPTPFALTGRWQRLGTPGCHGQGGGARHPTEHRGPERPPR